MLPEVILRIAIAVAALILLLGGGSARADQCGTFRVTAYTHTGNLTYDGTSTYNGEWLVAVDPNVIPLQSTVHVVGVGYYRAADTGGGVIGNHVDLLMHSHYEAVQWGSQYLEVCW